MKNKRKKSSKKYHRNSFKSIFGIALFAILPLIYLSLHTGDSDYPLSDNKGIKRESCT